MELAGNKVGTVGWKAIIDDKRPPAALKIFLRLLITFGLYTKQDWQRILTCATFCVYKTQQELKWEPTSYGTTAALIEWSGI